MALPETIRVKLSSEAAGSITITPVVVQDIRTHELVEYILGVVGKDAARVREILLRGSFVSGGSRFRFSGCEATLEDVLEALAAFPDADPSLPFTPARCLRAVLRGGRQAIEIPREAASGGGVFHRENFWDALMETIGTADYAAYSYRERADRYVRNLTAEERSRLRQAGERLRFTGLRDRVRTEAFTSVELYVARP